VRGSPLLRALLAFIVILMLGFPLRHLTRVHADANADAAGNVTPVPAATNAVRLQLTFSQLPTSVRVLHLGNEIWQEKPATEEIEREFQMEFPKEGVDLQFEIEWPGESLSAMRAILTDPEGNTLEKSVWGSGAVTQVVTFP
jgi:hypothetical protein